MSCQCKICGLIFKNNIDANDSTNAVMQAQKEMKEAARVLDFERAAQLRDILFELKC